MKNRSISSFQGVVWLVAVTLVASLMSGCTLFIENTAKQMTNREMSRKFEFFFQQTGPFIQCVDSEGGVCANPLKSADPAAAYDFFAVHRDVSRPDSRQLFSAESTEPPWEELGIDLEGASALKSGSTTRELIASSVAAGVARKVLNHHVQGQLDAIFNLVKCGYPPDGEMIQVDGDAAKALGITKTEEQIQATVRISAEDFDDYQNTIEAATLLGGWEALEREEALVNAALGGAQKYRIDRDTQRTRAYINQYMLAYFRKGRFFQATISAADLKRRIVRHLQDRIPGLPDADYQEMAESLFSQFDFTGDNYVFGQIDDTGFVTRGGQKLAFPAIEASFSLGSSNVSTTDVDFVAVGSDLIRVLLHAIYDSAKMLPAVSDATGVGHSTDVPRSANWLPVNDPLVTGVDEREFGLVETRAAQVEGVVAASVGRMVRGVSLFSLNNEALASAIETAIGVAVRKQVEGLVWCWYSCKYDETHRNLGDYIALSYGTKIVLEIEFVGGDHSGESP